MYKKVKDNITGLELENLIQRLSDKAFIPSGNHEYEEYLAWVALGNQPDPAE